MREIKYRAWIESEHKMVEVDSIDFSHKNITYYDKDFQCILVASFDLIELMQYTGLKDKNGTKIYEGDIVFVNYTLLAKNGLVTSQRGYVGKIREHSGCIVVQDKYEMEKYLWDIDNYSIEVLGNIYENTELLEA